MWMRLVTGACAMLLSLSAEEPKSRVPAATAGFGNILYPGTGAPPSPKPQFAKPIFQRQMQGGFRSVQPVTSVRPRVIILPVYFPVPFYGFAPMMNETLMAPVETSVAAIQNPNYVAERSQPVVREYREGSLPEPVAAAPTASIESEKPTVYLIAMKDSTIYSSLAYWVEDSTLHYITTQHSPNRASLDLVDRELSAQLNRERGVDFKLPAP